MIIIYETGENMPDTNAIVTICERENYNYTIISHDPQPLRESKGTRPVVIYFEDEKIGYDYRDFFQFLQTNELFLI